MTFIEIVGAVIRDSGGRLLTVRKRGTARFMLPGGKRDPGEGDAEALARELSEELGAVLGAHTLVGMFEAEAANEPDRRVRSHVYSAEITGEMQARAEIEELLWIDPADPPDIPLAPLLTEHVLPALTARR